jgi:hypothetical protein
MKLDIISLFTDTMMEHFLENRWVRRHPKGKYGGPEMSVGLGAMA